MESSSESCSSESEDDFIDNSEISPAEDFLVDVPQPYM